MQYAFPLLALLLFASCNPSAPKPDAYGNFEADERIVSAEANGQILALDLEEGQTLQAGQIVGAIDSLQLVLKKEQLLASMRAIAAKSPAIGAQLAVFERQTAAAQQQLATLQRERQRVQNLLKNDAATPKQLDDLDAQIEQAQRQLDVIGGQRGATGATLNTQKSGLLAEILPLQKQIAQLNDQLAQCRVVNPVAGSVLVKYAETGEIATFGKPLYKTADLGAMTLRAYVGGDQLGSIKTGQTVQVFIDGPDGGLRELSGTITWISPKAEFTPKIVQTRDERVNLVYAIKIAVRNEDGSLKIGMPGEVRF